MEIVATPALVLIAILVGVSIVSFKLAERGKMDLAWWLFLLFSLPILSSLILLYVYEWPETATQEGVSMVIADKIGELLVMSLVSSGGLLFAKNRPLGMLTLLILISNSSYFFGVSMVPRSGSENISIFLASIVITATFFTIRRINFEKVIGQRREVKAASIMDGQSTYRQFQTEEKLRRGASVDTQVMAAYAAIGAGLSCLIILVFSVVGGEQRAFFAILNNPDNLVIPAVLGAAMGFGYAVVRKK